MISNETKWALYNLRNVLEYLAERRNFSLTELRVLNVLAIAKAENQPPLSATEVAEKLGLARSTISGVMRTLHQIGYIDYVGSDDGRKNPAEWIATRVVDFENWGQLMMAGAIDSAERSFGSLAALTESLEERARRMNGREEGSDDHGRK